MCFAYFLCEKDVCTLVMWEIAHEGRDTYKEGTTPMTGPCGSSSVPYCTAMSVTEVVTCCTGFVVTVMLTVSLCFTVRGC